jgi:cytochrome b involved in lipid metabolism
LEWAGKDGTKDFRKANHSQEAKDMLKQYKIGELISVSLDFNLNIF